VLGHNTASELVFTLVTKFIIGAIFYRRNRRLSRKKAVDGAGIIFENPEKKPPPAKAEGETGMN